MTVEARFLNLEKNFVFRKLWLMNHMFGFLWYKSGLYVMQPYQ